MSVDFLNAFAVFYRQIAGIATGSATASAESNS